MSEEPGHAPYSAWALSPVTGRGMPRAATFQRIRLIAPETVLRTVAGMFSGLGGWSSTLTSAPPPLERDCQLILAGTFAQFDQLCETVGSRQVAGAISELLQALTSGPPAVTLGRHRFDFAARVYLVGILNNTPDSFYDWGRHFGMDAALTRAEQMVREGADVIEVGGETAQEGPRVPVAEEVRRVAPLVEELVRRFDVPIAVDTYKPEVAHSAIEAGAVLVNDISGLSDPAMAAVIARSSAGVVLMHLHGRPKQHYVDVDVPSMMDWVAAFLRERTKAAVAAGIPRDRILVDPGLNFGKHTTRDLELMQRLPELRSLGYPIFVATSRKDYIRDLLHLHPDELLEGTAAAVAFAIAQGANMLRVHDVQTMVRVTRMMEYFCGYRQPSRVTWGVSGQVGGGTGE